jgi:hypothetical protein
MTRPSLQLLFENLTTIANRSDLYLAHRAFLVRFIIGAADDEHHSILYFRLPSKRATRSTNARGCSSWVMAGGFYDSNQQFKIVTFLPLLPYGNMPPQKPRTEAA